MASYIALSLGMLVAWTGSHFLSSDGRGGGIGKSRGVVVVSCAYRHVTSTAESSPRTCVWLLLPVDYLSHSGLPPDHGATVRSGSGPPHCRGFTTIRGRTPLDEWSAWRRDLYLTTHNTHKRHPCSRRNSNPQSQQLSVRRPTLQTTRPMRSVKT